LNFALLGFSTGACVENAISASSIGVSKVTSDERDPALNERQRAEDAVKKEDPSAAKDAASKASEAALAADRALANVLNSAKLTGTDVDADKVKEAVKNAYKADKAAREASVYAAQAGARRSKISDQRDDIRLTFHTGIAIDNFAADETKVYLNFDASNKTKNRGVVGFDIEYRLMGDGDSILSESHTLTWNPQLWLYGNTLHGMRSAEVDCNAHPNLTVCKGALATAPAKNDNLYLLRNATSLEGYLGMRMELFTLQPTGAHPANIYINGQLGFLTIADNGGDVVDMHHLGVGAIVIGGPYKNSFIETGYGRSDIFLRNRHGRWKFIAKAVWNPERAKKIIGNPTIFAKMVADTDMGTGADSIQTYIGVSFDLGKGASLF